MRLTRPEIMRPLRDAVSFVDADEGNRRQRLEDATEKTSATGNRFRREKKEVKFSGFDFFQNFFADPLRLVEVKTSGSDERRKSSDLWERMSWGFSFWKYCNNYILHID